MSVDVGVREEKIKGGGGGEGANIFPKKCFCIFPKIPVVAGGGGGRR